MVMPLAGRVVAAVAGGLLVLVAVSSVTLTLIVSRPVNSRLTRWVDRMVDWAYQQVVVHVADARRRDQLAHESPGWASAAFGPTRSLRPRSEMK
jgi:hypothetical protein